MSEMTAEKAAALRKPFPREAIGQLPKPYKKDSQKGDCRECGQYHGLPAMHLDYVGHAAVTDRLLAVDPAWTWEPMATDPQTGAPLLANGGLWIRLTICGVTRIGYGDGNSVKEMIGDAIRNACLARGTLVTTARGLVPIQDVRVGDLVPTRQGWRPVTDHWLSNPSAPVVRVELDSGHTLVGTRNHRVPTTEGDVTLGTLRNGAMMFTWQDTDARRTPRLSSGGGASGAELLGDATSRPLPRLAGSSTGPSTSTTTAPSPMATTSTTSTMTRETTTPTTSSPCTRATTGTTTTPVAIGTHEPAEGAGGHSRRERPGLRGARRLAKRLSAALMESPTFLRARARSASRESARSVARPTWRERRGPGIAVARVVSVRDAGTAEVWNLSVGDVHEYAANGVLVYNSMRFGVALDLWAKESLVEGQHDEPRSAKPDPDAVERHRLRTEIADLAKEHGWDPGVLGQEFTATYGTSTLTAAPADLAAYLGLLGERAHVAALDPEPDRPDRSEDTPSTPEPADKTPTRTPADYAELIDGCSTRREVVDVLRRIGQDGLNDEEVGGVSLQARATRKMQELPG